MVAVLSGAGCASKWVLRLASATAFTTALCGPETDGADKAVLAGIGLRLSVSQDPYGLAEYGTTVWSKQSSGG